MDGTMGEDGRNVKVRKVFCFPDAVQRAAVHRIRDRPKLSISDDPGSATHHFVLRCARETRL